MARLGKGSRRPPAGVVLTEVHEQPLNREVMATSVTKIDAECARACFRHGASYVLVNGDRRYTLVGGESALSKLAGERANVIGTRQGDAILVNSASAAIF